MRGIRTHNVSARNPFQSQTCKMNSVDPLDWLSQTLTRIAQGWPASEIEMLMPWNFRPDVIG
nr:transposase domain-containing protein [Mesorhizobium sp. AR10]